MKQYRIERKAECGVIAKVVAEHGEYPLPHIVCHSPTGFETGYGGSGPGDLALAILADHFDESESVVREGYRKSDRLSRAVRLYTLFKFDMIAPRRLEMGASYTITSEEIDGWLAARDQQTYKEVSP